MNMEKYFLENMTGFKIINVMFNYSADVILPKKRKNQLMDIYSIETVCLNKLNLTPVMEIRNQNEIIVKYYNVNGILYTEATDQKSFNQNIESIQKNNLTYVRNYEFFFPKKETPYHNNINCEQKILKNNLQDSKILSNDFENKKKQFQNYFKDFVWINGKICYPCPLPLYTLSQPIANNECRIKLFKNWSYDKLFFDIHYSIKHKHHYITNCFPIFEIENLNNVINNNTINVKIFDKEFLKKYYEMSYEKNMFFIFFVKNILENPIFNFNKSTIEDLQKITELKDLINTYEIREQNDDMNIYILKLLKDVSHCLTSKDSFPIEFIENYINSINEEKLELKI